MKNKIDKKVLFSIMIVIIISLLTNVVAETLIKSADVSYVDNSNLKATNVQAAIDGTCTKFSTELQSFLLKVYPVNSVYISYSNTNPGTLFGGTWENIGNGKVLRGISSGTAGTTGGSETVTLKEENLPSHRHSIPALSGTTNSTGSHVHETYIITDQEDFGYTIPANTTYFRWSTGVIWTQTSITNRNRTPGSNTESAGNHTHTVTTSANNTGYAGSGKSFTTLDPYITVYMWKRTK